MYKKVSTDLKFVEREQEVLKYWKDNRIFEKSLKTAHRAYYYTYDKGYHPQIQDNEGLRCPQKSGMGYSWPAG